MISDEDNKYQNKIAKRDQKMSNGINAQAEVVKKPGAHWNKLNNFVIEKKDSSSI